MLWIPWSRKKWLHMNRIDKLHHFIRSFCHSKPHHVKFNASFHKKRTANDFQEKKGFSRWSITSAWTCGSKNSDLFGSDVAFLDQKSYLSPIKTSNQMLSCWNEYLNTVISHGKEWFAVCFIQMYLFCLLIWWIALRITDVPPTRNSCPNMTNLLLRDNFVGFMIHNPWTLFCSHESNTWNMFLYLAEHDEHR